MAIEKVQKPLDAAGQASAKAKELLEKELAEAQKSHTNIYDYLDLRVESNLKKIMEKNKEDLGKSNIFTDYVTRINSHSERSLKIIVISSIFRLTKPEVSTSWSQTARRTIA